VYAIITNHSLLSQTFSATFYCKWQIRIKPQYRVGLKNTPPPKMQFLSNASRLLRQSLHTCLICLCPPLQCFPLDVNLDVGNWNNSKVYVRNVQLNITVKWCYWVTKIEYQLVWRYYWRYWCVLPWFYTNPPKQPERSNLVTGKEIRCGGKSFAGPTRQVCTTHHGVSWSRAATLRRRKAKD